MATVFRNRQPECKAISFAVKPGRQHYVRVGSFDDPDAKIPGLKDPDTFSLTVAFGAASLGDVDGDLEVVEDGIRYSLQVFKSLPQSKGLSLAGIVKSSATETPNGPR